MVKAKADPAIISFCTGTSFGCAVFDNKKMKCWGQEFAWGLSNSASDSDSLGDGLDEVGDNLPYINVGTNANIEQVSCGELHLCMRLDTGDMKCLGSNNRGQTGMGLSASTDPIGSWNGYIGNNLPVVNLGNGLKVLNIALGLWNSCVVVTGNKVKCYGWNTHGQLGYGDQVDRGASASQMGDALPLVDFGTDVEVASIHTSCSAYHNCVILSAPIASAQRIKCWGLNDNFQLGYPDKINRGVKSGQMGDSLSLVDLGTESRVKQLALGRYHTCALLINGVLKCWGFSNRGQLALGKVTIVNIPSGEMSTIQIDDGKTPTLIAAGGYHTCIAYNDGITMKCVGDNEYGQLGQGDAVQRGHTSTTMIPSIPAIQLGTSLLQIASIHCGDTFTCILFVDSTVKCFGNNYYGQLAIGSKINAGDKQNDMGNRLLHASFFGIPQTYSPTLTPISLPTSSPTASPTKNCQFSKKKCTADKGCIWQKVGKTSSCVQIICKNYKTKKTCKPKLGCTWDGTSCS